MYSYFFAGSNNTVEEAFRLWLKSWQPSWLIHEIDLSDVFSIYQGGCASGAFIPAVTYHIAEAWFNTHSEDMLQYVRDNDSNLVFNFNELPFSEFCTRICASAVEYFVFELVNILDENGITQDNYEHLEIIDIETEDSTFCEIFQCFIREVK